MPLSLTPNSAPHVTDIPEETFPAICVGIFDLGTVHSDVFNSDSMKIQFVFEIPEVRNDEGFPATVTTRPETQSINPKSNLFRILQAWRGKSFSAKELELFDVKEFLGKPALVQVVHKHGDGARKGSVWANIGQISAMPRGMEHPKPYRTPIYFDFADGVAAIPEGTPEFIADKIVASPEWAALKAAGGKPQAAGRKAPAKKKPDQSAPAEIIDILNEVGLAWPYTQEELDKVYPIDFGLEAYATLSQHAVPF